MKKTFRYWFFHILFSSIRFLWHWLMVLKHGGKGKVVPPVTNPLLLHSASKLAQDIREGKLKSEEVVQAYIDRIQEVEPYINATAEPCFEDALKRATEVDSLISSGSYSKEYLLKEKPLLGVPFSIKLVFKAKGLRCTAGYKAFENIIATEDAPVVALLKKAGAILLTSTNTPELLTNIESTNKLYGTTRNPYNTSRTSGGSSGGEGALIAAGGSVFGLGNDLLGSLRIPAHFCGIFSHKPTRELVPNTGSFPPERPGKLAKPSEIDVYDYVSTGPLCRYAEDLIISMKSLSSTSGVQIDFDKKVDFSKIKMYYLKEIRSPFVPLVDKDIVSSLEKVVSYFESRYKKTIQEVKMPSLSDSNRCVLTTIFSRMKSVQKSFMGGEELGFSEKLDFLKSFVGQSVLCFATLVAFNLAQCSLWYHKDRTSYYQKMVQDWAAEFSKLLDRDTVLLMPTFPEVAPYHSEGPLTIPGTCYTSIFNVLGLPVTQCPVGFTKQRLPYGIQIVGRANDDALTIACAVELEKAFGGWKSPGKV